MKPKAGEKNKIDDEEINIKLIQKNINPLYFTDRVLKVGFTITLYSHDNNHAKNKITVTPKDFDFEIINFKTIVKEMANVYARLKNR